MALRAEKHKVELIDELANSVRDRVPREWVALAEKFARLYYQNVPPEDILREDRENLYGAAVGLYQFAAHRPAAGPKIRIFNPTHDEHGRSEERLVGKGCASTLRSWWSPD